MMVQRGDADGFVGGMFKAVPGDHPAGASRSSG